ncbi:MAG: T9SS type A sorting domain-containing protein [Cytophagaceae bacterium]
MIRSIKIFSLLLIVIFLPFSSLHAQVPKDCPSYPAVNYFDTTCFIYIGNNEIKLGQGRVRLEDLWGDYLPTDIYVPSNRPAWAIAQAHGWHLTRNILKYEMYDIHTFAATMMKESFLGCDGAISFAGLGLTYPVTGSTNFQPTNFLNVRDGCFHIDQSTGLPQLTKYYPRRFAGVPDHQLHIGGNHYIRSILSKTLYDLTLVRLRDYSDGLDLSGMVQATLDPLSSEKYIALGYNRGYNSGELITPLQTPNRPATTANANWLTLPSFNYDYTRAISHVVRVLSNNLYTGNPIPRPKPAYADSDNQWHNWYDYMFTWNEVNAYLDSVLVFYGSDADPVRVKTAVQAAFDSQKDGSNRVSFRYKFGPVLDAIVLNLPYDEPMPVILSSTDGVDGCSGKVGPDVKLTAMGPVTFCQGMSVELVTNIGTGFTYEWKKDNVVVLNPNTDKHIFTVTQSGSYIVSITAPNGAKIPAPCPIAVTVNNCSNCSMTATAIATNNTCTGMADGKINVSLANFSGKLPVTYSWSGPQAGSVNSTLSSYEINNLQDGQYTIEVTSVADPLCKAFASVRINSTTSLYQGLTVNKTVTDCNKASLQAVISNSPPASCTYNLRIEGDMWGFWDNSIFGIEVLSNGSPQGPYSPRANGGGNPVFLNENITLAHGATLVLRILNKTVTPRTGAAFFVRLFNPQNNQILNYNMSGVNYPVGSTQIFTTTVNCSEPLPAYTYSWSPAAGLSSVNTAATNATVSATTNYTVTATHPTKPGCALSRTVQVEYNCTLPVRMLEFELERNGNYVDINWITSMEENSDRFIIERSGDGVSFSAIASVKAFGKSSGPKVYSYTDRQPFPGINYYKLTALDVDGSIAYSAVRTIVMDSQHTVLVYPNPYENSFSVKFSGNSAGTTLELVDLTGKVHERILIEENYRTIEMGANISDGIYFLKVYSSSDNEIVKVIKGR